MIADVAFKIDKYENARMEIRQGAFSGLLSAFCFKTDYYIILPEDYIRVEKCTEKSYICFTEANMGE